MTTTETVGPYPAGTRWTFRTRSTGYTKTTELTLLPEPDGSDITDEYAPDELTAHDLWTLWVNKVTDEQHKKHPDADDPGEVRIHWTVMGVAELVPHSVDARATRTDPHGFRDNFDVFYTHPAHAVTGEPLNWLRLPVLDLGWNATGGDRGGFIQEVTGWKPAPLQATMNVRRLGAAAGLYVPPS